MGRAPGGAAVTTTAPDAGDPQQVATRADRLGREPVHAHTADIDLVGVRDDEVPVSSGRCPHRGGHLGVGQLMGEDLICGVHGWDYRVDTGIGGSDDSEVLGTFRAWVDGRGDRHDGGPEP